jgi:hypothetical protein
MIREGDFPNFLCKFYVFMPSLLYIHLYTTSSGRKYGQRMIKEAVITEKGSVGFINDPSASLAH